MAARRILLWNMMRVPRRTVRDRSNPLELLSEDDIFQRYRFRSATIFFICSLISDTISHQTQRSCPLPPLLQVLAALRFYATGSFYQLIGDSLCVSKSAVGRAVRAVTSLLSALSARFIKFPSQNDISSIRTKFYQLAGKINYINWIKLIPSIQKIISYHRLGPFLERASCFVFFPREVTLNKIRKVWKGHRTIINFFLGYEFDKYHTTLYFKRPYICREGCVKTSTHWYYIIVFHL